MSDSTPPADNVTQLADAIKGAAERKARERKPKDKDREKGGGGGPPPRPPFEKPSLPDRLPIDAPVKALGTLEGMYYYLDSLGQLRRNKQSEHGRLHILDLFPWEYLCETWPVWTIDTSGVWKKKNDFQHSYLAPVLMGSCKEKGVWDPSDRVRGCGTWIEDTGELVMHCGGHLWRAFPKNGTPIVREDAGLRGDLLYPRRAPLAEPLFEKLDQTGPRMMEQLDTWNFKQGELGQRIVLGEIVACILGQAPHWRPMMWVTGGKGTGKSTLETWIEWVLGDRASVKPTATSQAYVYQKLGDSSLPVLLDEFEAKENNQRQQDVIELMRIASSRGELGRGGSENNPRTYNLKSCFIAFSILIPPLSPQDRSRITIVELRPLRRRSEELELPLAAEEFDLALGEKARWLKTGRELRGRVLQHWHRYRATYHAYFKALSTAGMDPRAAAQFGALGAGQDIALYDTLDPANVKHWVGLLPDAAHEGTRGYQNEPEACLQHLLAYNPDTVRHGSRESVAWWLREGKKKLESDDRGNDPDDANRVLAKLGIRIYRDKDRMTIDSAGRDVPLWWVAISSTHPALAEAFKTTHWKGKAGAPGTWAQALRGLDETGQKAIQMRIDGHKNWVVPLLWDVVFPPFNETDDAEEIAEVSAHDRVKTEKEKRGGA